MSQLGPRGAPPEVPSYQDRISSSILYLTDLFYMVTTQLLPDKIAHTMGGKILLLLLLAMVTFSECYVAIIDCTGKEGKVS